MILKEVHTWHKPDCEINAEFIDGNVVKCAQIWKVSKCKMSADFITVGLVKLVQIKKNMNRTKQG